jgi:hypothetical protein
MKIATSRPRCQFSLVTQFLDIFPYILRPPKEVPSMVGKDSAPDFLLCVPVKFLYRPSLAYVNQPKSLLGGKAFHDKYVEWLYDWRGIHKHVLGRGRERKSSSIIFYFFYLVGWDLTPIRSLCRSPRFV